MSQQEDAEGLKTGAQDDPFNDDGEQTNGDATDTDTASGSGDSSDVVLGGVDETPLEGMSAVETVPFEDSEYPLKMARENVKSSRDGKTLQIGTYSETVERHMEGEKVMNSTVSDKLSKMDFNEAVLLAGLANLDDVHRILKVWGYDNDASMLG